MSYGTDRAMSDRYIPRIKSIVGPRLLSVTPDEIDCKQAADLMIFAARDMRIAARVRRPGFAAKYAYQFTIRSLRDSGAETELSKIMAGWGDWFFYGHAAGHLDEIPLWWLIDLGEFRSAMIDPTGLVHGVTPNGDGTHFAWFDVRSFPNKRKLVLAFQWPNSLPPWPLGIADARPAASFADLPLFAAAKSQKPQTFPLPDAGG